MGKKVLLHMNKCTLQKKIKGNICLKFQILNGVFCKLSLVLIGYRLHKLKINKKAYTLTFPIIFFAVTVITLREAIYLQINQKETFT